MAGEFVSAVAAWIGTMAVIVAFYIILGLILGALGASSETFTTEDGPTGFISGLLKQGVAVLIVVIISAVLVPIGITWVSANIFIKMREPDAYMVENKNDMARVAALM